LRTSIGFDGKVDKHDEEDDDDNDDGVNFLVDDDLVVRVAASLALRDSVKHEATLCMESPSGVTTLLSWCRYLLASMYSPFATASAHARSKCTS
jgi:hypothetical protein